MLSPLCFLSLQPHKVGNELHPWPTPLAQKTKHISLLQIVKLRFREIVQGHIHTEWSNWNLVLCALGFKSMLPGGPCAFHQVIYHLTLPST